MQKRTAASSGSSAIARRLHGEYGSVLEAGMEHLGGAVHMGVGQRPARQECARPQDGHERQRVAGRMAPARMASRKLCSAPLDSGFARLDTNASGSGPGIFPDGQWDSESAGGCQHPASRVASDTLGKSGQAMLAALIAGQSDLVPLADLAVGTWRGKLPQLRRALEGLPRKPHRFLLKRRLTQWRFVESETEWIDQRLEQIGKEEKIAEAVARWDTVPGVDRMAAWGLVAEMGIDMEQFPSARHAASWSGVCPGNHESAGKRLGGRTRKGNPWLRRNLGQSAWAVAAHQEHPYGRTVPPPSSEAGPEASDRSAWSRATCHRLLCVKETVFVSGSGSRLLRSDQG